MATKAPDWDSQTATDTQQKYRWYLRALLAMTAAGLMLALIAVFLPVNWMAAAHQWLGLGDFPDAPITRYLARSTSLLYFVHGCIIGWIAWKLDQLHSMVPLLAILHIALGITMLGIDLTSPMPAYWIVGEGIPVALMGALMGWLYGKAKGNSLQGTGN